MKTEWFDPRTHLPARSGFYELALGFNQMAWYAAPEQAFYTCSGFRHDAMGETPGFLWRGVVEVLGRRRRSLVD